MKLCKWQFDLHGAENVLYNIFQDPKKFPKKNVLKFPTYRQISLLTVLVTDSVWVNQLVWIGFSLDINLPNIEIRKKYQESQHPSFYRLWRTQPVWIGL